jgi:Uma2 family endonuclease
MLTTLPLTLETFLEFPQTNPALEFINGEIVQKPKLQGEQGVLQARLCAVINQTAEPQKIAFAFPELRCVLSGNAIVPDAAVFRWERIPSKELGVAENRFQIYPDWVIEILSPDQSLTKVLGKLLDCIQHGTELGWLLNPLDKSILTVLPGQRVQVLTGESVLPVLDGIHLSLRVADIFRWLWLD